MTEFKSYTDLSNINDSMELDSGFVRAELKKDNYMLELRTCGEVRVDFEDERYTCASNMPDELIELFHNGKAYTDERVNIIENNWFEVFLYEWEDGVWIWSGQSDVWDCEGMSADELKGEMESMLDEWVRDYK